MSSGRVRDKVALVTGGGSGIGQATAVLSAEEGRQVVVADIDLDAAEKVAAAISQQGGTAEAFGLDVADEMDWARAIEATLF